MHFKFFYPSLIFELVNRFFLFGLALSSVLSGVGCDYNRSKNAATSEAPMTTEMASHIDYTVVYEKVFKTKCIQCHSAAGGNKGEANLETYPATLALLMRIKVRALSQRSMPPAQALSTSEAQILSSWIDKGAPESLTDDGVIHSTAISEHPNWLAIRNILFARSCLACHSGSAPDGRLDLNSLSAVREKASKIFDRMIVKKDMPLEPFVALTPFEKLAFTNWVLEGMLE